MIFHGGMDADAVIAPSKGYIKGFDLATGTEIWSVSTGVTYDQVCKGVACVGNEVYAMKFPPSNGGPGLFGKIVKYDYSTGHAKDSISIPAETFDEMFLVASDGKVYSPHLRN